MVNRCKFTSLYPVFDYEGLDSAWVDTELNSILYLGVGVMILSPALINFFPINARFQACSCKSDWLHGNRARNFDSNQATRFTTFHHVKYCSLTQTSHGYCGPID